MSEKAEKSRQRRSRRYAERVLVDGVLIHPDAPHGTATGYTEYGCHCNGCKAAANRNTLRWIHERYAERMDIDGVLIHPNAPHGTPHGYGQYGCHCARCSDAHAQAARRNRRKKS